jgi:hypothetical protein
VRPLEVLSLARKLHWDLVCLDDSELGRGALETITHSDMDCAPLVGIGLECPSLITTVRLPMIPERLVALIEAAVPHQNGAGAQPIDMHADRRIAAYNGLDVTLTRTEYRLLEYFLERRDEETSPDDLLKEVWGFQSDVAGAALVRAHVRNLRAKLAKIGLPDAIRSHRGRGYALVI